MKKKPLILSALLLMLYIVPMILAPSYSSVAIPTEQNTSKDFVISSVWLDGWDYRKSITLTGSGNKTYWNVYLTVSYESDMDSDFVDLRFSDTDAILLDYWIESYIADTSALVWVEIPTTLDSSDTIHMYYGNVNATSLSSGSNTFIFYEDWTGETIDTDVRWDITQEGGSVSWDDTDAIHGSVIKMQGNAGSNKYAILSKSYWFGIPRDGYSSDYSLRMRTNAESTSASSQIVQIGFVDVDVGSAKAHLKSYQGADQFNVADDDANADIKVISGDNFDTYSIFDINRNGTHAILSRGGVLQSTASMDPDENECKVNLYCRDSEFDLYNDWLLVYKWISGVGFSFGSEEEAPAQVWNENGVVDFLVIVPVDETGLNMVLILFGLVLIPCSTLYLVKGGSSELSSEKFFFFCIAFVMGWALFLGGIL